jgi:lipoprotein-anchoring transpeptidase ErfK/SrfK
MIKFNKNTTPVALAAVIAVNALMLSLSFADSDSTDPSIASLSVSNNDSIGITDPSDLNDLTVEETAAFLQSEHEGVKKGSLDGEYARIQHFDPATASGKIIIRVHESTDPQKLEYLEVLRQKSADPSDVEAVDLFENGSKNTAYVSTAGSFMIDGKMKKFSTPTGTFAIDRLELMHHSKTYDDAAMPNSMFFNEGIAIHAAIGGEIPHLGHVASHGCVRTAPITAKTLYDYVQDNKLKSSVVIEVLAS